MNWLYRENLYCLPILSYFPFPTYMGRSALPLLLYNKLSLWKEGCIINSISSDDFVALYGGSVRIIKVCKTNLFTNRFGSCVLWSGLVCFGEVYFYIQTAFAANHEF